MENFCVIKKVPWVLNVLHGTINANKEPLFLKFSYWPQANLMYKVAYCMNEIHEISSEI